MWLASNKSGRGISCALLVVSVLTGVCGSAASAQTFRAVMVGPNYPPPPANRGDARSAADRVTAMSARFALWGNWNANNITVINGGVTPNQVTNAIGNAGVGANDVFVLFYHGHGTYAGAPLVGG